VIEISFDPSHLIASCKGMEAQLPFATARALNELATTFQIEEREVIQRAFTIRRPWVLSGVKINRGDFATKTKPYVVIHIDPSRDFLSKFERGGVRTPSAGGKSLAIPLAVRPTPQTVVPMGKRPRAFNFRQVQSAKVMPLLRKRFQSESIRRATGDGRLKVFVGDKNTILLQANNGSGVILQRIGRGKQRAGLKVLYTLRPKTPVPADLHFVDTAYKSFNAHWRQSFTKWWNESVRTAHTGAPIAQGMVLPAGFSE
jgi:hypothetical protein